MAKRSGVVGLGGLWLGGVQRSRIVDLGGLWLGGHGLSVGV